MKIPSRRIKINGIENIIHNTSGLWITALFDGILVPNPALTFSEHKEAFFWLVEKLLQDGKIKFCPPNELWREGYDIWNVDISTIMTYLRSHWPQSVNSKNDIALADYFYAIPSIIWIDDNGEILQP
ncbi:MULTISPECIES: hypothetical protein [Paraburkholderia]|uniref:hypothetical protein n=1 Tax=Paraburkholderia TaxID=1822464 RepID=UPI002AAFB5EE|nr:MULTISPECIES: hypothetical protein [Paraburkholderia]